jgi:DNA-binding transcriptional ArsR family regulator
MPPDLRRDLQPDIEAVAEQVFTALADPSRRAILAALAAGGPATATDLAARLPDWDSPLNALKVHLDRGA